MSLSNPTQSTRSTTQYPDSTTQSLAKPTRIFFQGDFFLGFFCGSWKNEYEYIYNIYHYYNNEHYDDIKHLENDYHTNDQKLELLKDHNKDNCDGQEHYHDHGDFFLRGFFPRGFFLRGYFPRGFFQGDFIQGDFFLGDFFLGGILSKGIFS